MTQRNMVLHRVERDRKYASVNLTAIEDPRLTGTAKALHTYAMTRPDGWELRTEDIYRRFKEGESAIGAAFKCLEQHRYLKREKTRLPAGTLAPDGETNIGGTWQWVYTWFEVPYPSVEIQGGSTGPGLSSLDNPDWSPISNNHGSIDQGTTNHEQEEATPPAVVGVPVVGELMPTDKAFAEACCSIVESVPGYPGDGAKDVPFFLDLRREFGALNIIEQLQGWKVYKIDHPLDGKSSARSQIRNWMRIARDGTKRGRHRGREPSPQQRSLDGDEY